MKDNKTISLDEYSTVLLVSDIMKILKISKPIAYRLLQNGLIKSCKVGREYKIAKSHLIEFIENNFIGGVQNDR